MKLLCIFIVGLLFVSVNANELFEVSWDNKKNAPESSELGPQAIAVDGEKIYLLHNFTKTIFVFSATGKLLEKINYEAEGCGLVVSGKNIAVYSPIGKSVTWVRGKKGTVTVNELSGIAEVWFDNNTWWARSGWQVVALSSKAVSSLSQSFPINAHQLAIGNQNTHSIITFNDVRIANPIAHASKENVLFTAYEKDALKIFSCSADGRTNKGISVKKNKNGTFCHSYVSDNHLYEMIVDKNKATIYRQPLNLEPYNDTEITNEQVAMPTYKKVAIEAIPTYIKVWYRSENKVRTVKLQDYLKHVVAGEIYASWSLEAHRAMAVAARSYTLGRKRHSNAQVCTTTHCQTWEANVDWKSSRAVDDTNGVAIYHNGRIIGEALYFAHCNGRTRNSEEKWNYNPYLRKKSCSCGHTKYFGHGVGACQYGLESYAKQGWSYKQILEHYYTGVVVK